MRLQLQQCGVVVAALVVELVVVVAVLKVVLLVDVKVVERSPKFEPAVTVGGLAWVAMQQVVTNTALATLQQWRPCGLWPTCRQQHQLLLSRRWRWQPQ